MSQEAYSVDRVDVPQYDFTALAAIIAGQVIQCPDGLAGIVATPLSAGAAASAVKSGLFRLPKTADIVLLDGQECYWDASANAVHFKPVNDSDFYLGTVRGDAAAADTEVVINLNGSARYAYDMHTDAALSVATGTAAAGGFGLPNVFGGARQLQLTATSEVQCVDILSVDRRAVDAGLIFEAVVRPAVNGSGAAVDFNIGLANGTSTSDADAVTEHVFFHIDGASTAIYGQSKDGTTTVAAADTTKTITAGSAVANRVHLMIDARDPESVKLYVDCVRVLSGSTFRLDNASGPLGALAHLEKSTGTTTGDFLIDMMRLRTSGE